MDINHIQIPPALLADLYKDSLVSEPGKEVSTIPGADTETNTVTGNPVKGWKYLGGNNKNILVVVSHPDAVHLPDNELQFLTGILNACKLSLADVAILNRHHYPDDIYKDVITFFKSRIVLLFDVEPSSFGLPLNFPHYQLQPFTGNTFLYVPSLQQIEADKVEKSKLWVCLKRLFNL